MIFYRSAYGVKTMNEQIDIRLRSLREAVAEDYATELDAQIVDGKLIITVADGAKI